jgi:DNA-binding IclR family transcriptional regulator
VFLSRLAVHYAADMATQDDAATSVPPDGKGVIQVLSRATNVLRALHGEEAGLSLSQIAVRAGLPRSTVHRLITALEHEGLVAAASPTGRMRIGPELLRLAGAGPPDVQQLLHPIMEQLHEQLQETVDLAVLEGDHLRFIDQIAAPHRLRAVSAVGATFPLHCTANGKAVLAQLSPAEIERLVPPRLPRHTPNTITSRRALLEDVESIGPAGLAVDHEEHTIGICAMGFAVDDGAGRYAAITVPMPTLRYDGQEHAVRRALTSARRTAVEAVRRHRGGD